jgi:anti-sigma regulatory factor (Ser/Thr protein kinase)
LLELCVNLEGTNEDLAVARRFVADTLDEWHLSRFGDDACLVVSELVANAVIHSRTAIRVTVRSDGVDLVRVEVYDENSRLPTQSSPPLDATSGRGLAIVGAVATSWGTQSHDDGKTVWAQLGTGPMDAPACIDATPRRRVNE